MILDGWTLLPWARSAPTVSQTFWRSLRVFLGGGQAVATCDACGPLVEALEGTATAYADLHSETCGPTWVTVN